MKSTLPRLAACGILLSVITMGGLLRADDTSAKDGSKCTKCQTHHHCHGKKKSKDTSSTDNSDKS